MPKPPANDPYDWQRTIGESVDEMLRLVDEAENYIYDYVFPALLKTKGPEAEREFYQSLNWDALQQLSPKLFTKYSERALTLEEQQRAQAQKALDDLSYSEFEQGRAFRPQVQTPNILGLRAPGGAALTTGGMGLDVPASLPMGVLGAGP